MKGFIIELIGGAAIGAIAGIIIAVMNIDMTGVQVAILVGSIIMVTTLVNSLTKKLQK